MDPLTEVPRAVKPRVPIKRARRKPNQDSRIEDRCAQVDRMVSGIFGRVAGDAFGKALVHIVVTQLNACHAVS